MRAFIINLDAATERWTFIEAAFAKTQLTLCRVPAVDRRGLQLPNEYYSEKRYRWFHGRTPNIRELACYLSHLKAIREFLTTDENHGLIGEDDLVLRPDFDAVLAAALEYSQHWNILRLTGLSAGYPAKVAKLAPGYSLCISLGRLKGAGAYVIDRTAATALLARLLPMRLPYDHAFDREWFMGLRAASISPFPVSQTESEFLSSVQPGTYPKLSRTHRCLTTYPYQACNEVTRWLFRALSYVRFQFSFRSAL